MEFENVNIHVSQDKLEFRLALESCAQAIKPRKRLCDLGVGIDQFLKARRIIVSDLRSVSATKRRKLSCSNWRTNLEQEFDGSLGDDRPGQYQSMMTK